VWGVTIIAASVLALVGFLFGFSQYPSAETAAAYGVLIGMASSAAWGAAALCGFFPAFTVPNNYLNMFAAIFAAASLGYLTAPDPFCVEAKDRPAWQGKNWLFEVQCRLRYFPLETTARPQVSDLVNKLGGDEQVLKRALARIAAVERRLEAIEQSSTPQSGPPVPGSR
jgi:hypothetical protein